MDISWFDQNTHYLLNDPPIRWVKYKELKEFYISRSPKKRIIFQFLEDYSRNLRESLVGVDAFILGGNSFKCNSDELELKIISAFTDTNRRPRHDITNKYFRRDGEKMKSYKGILSSMGHILIPEWDIKKLVGNPYIRELKHPKEIGNYCAPVGVVVIHFSEVMQ